MNIHTWSQRLWGCVALVMAWGLVLGACEGSEGGNDTDDVVEKTEFDCQLGYLNKDGSFHAFQTGDKAELMLGFQGFLLTILHVRAQGETPAKCDGKFSVSPEGRTPFGANVPQIKFTPVDTTTFESSEVLIFFNSGIASELVGRNTTITMKLESATAQCTTQVDVVLADDDPCIHTGEEPDCP